MGPDGNVRQDRHRDALEIADDEDLHSTTTSPTSLGVGETTPTGGGGQVGLLLISPYVKANSADVVDYFNHFSLLASIENLFGLHRLGYAGAIALPTFGAGVFNNYAG